MPPHTARISGEHPEDVPRMFYCLRMFSDVSGCFLDVRAVWENKGRAWRQGCCALTFTSWIFWTLLQNGRFHYLLLARLPAGLGKSDDAVYRVNLLPFSHARHALLIIRTPTKRGAEYIALPDKNATVREFQRNGVNASLEAEARSLGTLRGPCK